MTDRPLMIYEGACRFCREWIARWRRVTGERVAYAPYEEAADRLPHIPREDLARAVHLVEPDGRITRGAEAVLRSLRSVPGLGWASWLYRSVPGFAAVSEACYAWVAGHRSRGASGDR